MTPIPRRALLVSADIGEGQRREDDLADLAAMLNR